MPGCVNCGGGVPCIQSSGTVTVSGAGTAPNCYQLNAHFPTLACGEMSAIDLDCLSDVDGGAACGDFLVRNAAGHWAPGNPRIQRSRGAMAVTSQSLSGGMPWTENSPGPWLEWVNPTCKPVEVRVTWQGSEWNVGANGQTDGTFYLFLGKTMIEVEINGASSGWIGKGAVERDVQLPILPVSVTPQTQWNISEGSWEEHYTVPAGGTIRARSRTQVRTVGDNTGPIGTAQSEGDLITIEGLVW